MFFDVLFIKTKVEMSFLRHLYPAEPSILCFSLWLEFSWPFKLHGFRFNFKFSLNARSFLEEFAKWFCWMFPTKMHNFIHNLIVLCITSHGTYYWKHFIYSLPLPLEERGEWGTLFYSFTTFLFLIIEKGLS